MQGLYVLLLVFICFFAKAGDTPEQKRWKEHTKKITIIRDKYGVPHIHGKTDADAVFGTMYAQCEDNFERIERNYLEMLGRRAELEGESVIYDDLLMRLIADSSDAKKDFQNSPPWLKKLLIAHADAINYYLFKHPETKPAVLKRFEPWFHLMYTDGSVHATSTGGATLDELRNFYENKNNQIAFTRTLINDIDDRGSNGFAISPSRTRNGNAILYINPHVPFYFRNEMQMTSEEGLNAYGAFTWGQFFAYQGFNEHCGWMHTSGYADVADLYKEKVSFNNNTWTYLYENEQKPVKKKKIIIQYIKEGKLYKKTFTGYYTHHGPVVAKRGDSWISLKEYNRSLKALIQSWQTTKSNSLEEYKKAMHGLSNTTNNTVYADDKGNIVYWHGNFIPIRDTTFNWFLPVDGTTTKTEWKGVHRLDEIVQVINPQSGWIQNCNSTPFTSAGASSPLPKNYPNYMAPDGQNPRALNAIRLLKESKDITLENLIEIGYNRYLAAFDILLPSLLKAYKETDQNDSLKISLAKPIELLQSWNKIPDTHSIAATLAIEWASKLNALYPRSPVPEENTEQIGRYKMIAQVSSKHQQLQCLSEVVQFLQKNYGTWQIPWGDINRYQRITGKFNEVFDDNLPSIAVPLSSSRFGSLPAFESKSMPGTTKRYGYSGNSFIAAVEFGKKLRAKTIVTGGQDYSPSSPHFMDQASGFINGSFKEVFFYEEDLLKNKKKIYHPGRE